MVKHLLLFVFIFGCILRVPAQTGADSIITPVKDSLTHTDSASKDHAPFQAIDSFSKRPDASKSWNINPAIVFSIPELSREILNHHPWFGFSSKSFTMHSDLKLFKGKEILFYGLVLLLLIYAILRNAFPKYFSDLFRLFFRTTIKQRQIREQLMQTPFPSLLLNVFFIVTASLYIAFLIRHYQLGPVKNFWLTSLYCCLGLGLVYFVKFLGLKFSGWLFNMQEAAESYVFIVFIVNKMIGILLLPFVILLAFTVGNVYSIALSLSYCLLAGLLIYRFILTFGAIRNQVRVNPFHFFLWLCAFEIAPLLLVYKGLLLYFRQTT